MLRKIKPPSVKRNIDSIAKRLSDKVASDGQLGPVETARCRRAERHDSF